jgi:hypothetical protein
MAARWQLGTGQVIAAAFKLDIAEIEAMARLVARPPRDTRFNVSWIAASNLVATVDAVDGDRYLNDLAVTLSLNDGSTAPAATQTAALTIPQVAPGRYEISLASPRSPSLATVRIGGRVIERFAIAGRYAPEFDEIGNDRSAMNDMAARSGGGVIEPTQISPIGFRFARRSFPLTSILAASGTGAIALGLIVWKRKA